MAELVRLPRVKVCGVTTAADALAALEAGAEAIGMVWHPPSPRSIEVERAAEITAVLDGGALSVAVTVDRDPRAALDFCARSGVNVLQLCGRESARDWSDFPLPILRRVGVDHGARRQLDDWLGVACAFVLDHPATAGGSGLEVDAEIAAALARAAPCLLAGGLDASNVAERVRAVRPRGVDASSRLESAPRRKDAERVRAFVARALAALAEVEP